MYQRNSAIRNIYLRKGIRSAALWSIVFLLIVHNVSAQTVPQNDNFKNAEPITIADGGYGLGTYQSSKVNLTKATKEAGESIHLLQYFAGTDKKTVWFVFETQVPRNVTIELRQKDTLISQDAVGVTIYRTNSTSRPPNLGEVDAALVPISKFGSTGNTCLSPDKYYVQVSAKANANAEIWLKLVVDNASPADYDRANDAYDFGLLNHSSGISFDVGCLGIDSKKELMPALGSEYNQTAWFTFSTDNYSDLIALTFSAYQREGGSDTVCMGYRLYKGSAKNAFSKLKLVDSAVFKQACNPNNPQVCGQIGLVKYWCGLKSDTVYSIQLIFHKKAQYAFTLQMEERGENLSKSSNPKKLPFSYQAGILANRASFDYKDYFACNSTMSSNLCGKVNTPQVVDTMMYGGSVIRIDTFDLSLWATFEVLKSGYVVLQSNKIECKSYYNIFSYRLFKGDVTKSCDIPLYQKAINGGRYVYFCLEPGKYSLQILGRKLRYPGENTCRDIDLGKEADISIIYFEHIKETPSLYYKPANPEDLGDITPKLTTGVRSDTDYYGMQGDTVIIDGIQFFDRFHFRQFYLSKPTFLNIESSDYEYNMHTLFSGKVSDGISTLKRIKDSIYGYSTFGYNYPFHSTCTPLPAGWYTVVSTLQAGCYSNKDIKDYITLKSFAHCIKNFDRPYKASYFGDIDWGASANNPTETFKEYTLANGCFDCSTDTPFSTHPLYACPMYDGSPSVYTKTAYYVFNLKRESSLNISTLLYDDLGRGLGNTPYQLYRGDVRKDSLKFKDESLLMFPCNKGNQFCRLQPGVYTIVVLGNINAHINPRVTVEKVGISKYDHASATADLGNITPAIEKLSQEDIFYCTTGAQYTDPDTADNYFYFLDSNKTSVPYPMPQNYVMNRGNATERNLWYTFTCAGTGNITVKVYPKNQNSQNTYYRFYIYRSDEKYFGPFKKLVAMGKADSTDKQGLQLVTASYSQNVCTFTKLGCDTARYYIIVERPNNYYGFDINKIVQVGVKYENVRYDGPDADYCKNAASLSLNTTGETSATALINCHTMGEGFGEDGSNMACLIRDTFKYKTTWFKFKYTGSKKIELSFRLEENTSAQATEISYRVLYGTCDALTPGPCVENVYSYFKLDCMGPGEYYIQVVSPVNATGEITLFARADSSTYAVCKPIDLLNPLANFNFTGGCNNTPVQFINLSSGGKDISYAWKFGNGTFSADKSPLVQYKPKQFTDTFMVTLRVSNNLNNKYDEITLPVIVFRDPVTLNLAQKEITVNCGDKVKLEATSNYAYSRFEWNPKTGLDNPYSAAPVFTTASQDETYIVTMYAESCILTDTVHIYLHPKIPVSGDTMLCFGERGTLTAAPGFIYYYWSNGQNTQQITIDKPGKYWVYGSSNRGCAAMDTFIVENGSSFMSLGKDTAVCPGDEVELKPKTTGISYLWSTGETTPQIKVNKAGRYWLQMRKENELCIGYDTIEIFNKSFPFVDMADTAYLCGDEPAWIDITKPGCKYLWSNGSTKSALSLKEPGIYYVLISDGICTTRDSVIIKPVPAPTLNIGNDTFFCGNFGFLIDAGEWRSYNWQPGNITSKEILATEYGRYILKVINDEGCEASDTINISQQCDPHVWVPNAFTPGNDNLNDIFRPEIYDIFSLEMKIYNRWGELLFTTKEINKGWDGTFEGKACPPDVYIWTISYTSFHTNKYIYGTVNLLR